MTISHLDQAKSKMAPDSPVPASGEICLPQGSLGSQPLLKEPLTSDRSGEAI